MLTNLLSEIKGKTNADAVPLSQFVNGSFIRVQAGNPCDGIWLRLNEKNGKVH